MDHRRLLQDLLDLSALLCSADLDHTLHEIAELTVRHVQDDLEVGITLVEGAKVETGVWLGSAVCRVDSAQYDDGDGPCLEALRTGRPYEIEDMRQDRRWPPFASAAVGSGLLASLSLPLVTRGRTLGTINLYAHRARAFDDASRVAARTLADHAAVALDNARSYVEANQAALALPRHLLPQRLPTAPGVDLAARHRPARRASDVGGEWYDALALDGAGLAVAVGDVNGHGPAAAAVMGQVRIGLRAYLSQGGGPAQSLRLLSSLLADLEPDTLATACCLVLADAGMDQVDVRWASAGHLPPLLLPPSGAPTFLSAEPAPPVGVPLARERQEHHHRVARGSTLVLFTGGLVERRRRSLDEGLAHLRMVAASAPRAPDQLCDRLLDRLLGDDDHDGVAMLAVAVPPS